MLANNIFRTIGDFFTNDLFVPFETLRFIDNWWIQNTLNWVFIAVAFIALFYWIGELNKHNRLKE